MYPAEVFPTDVRTSGVGLASAVSRIGAAIGTWLLPVGLTSIGVGACMVIGGVRSPEESPRIPVPSGGHRRGEDRTGEGLEPLIDASLLWAPPDGMFQRSVGTGRWEAAGTGEGGRQSLRRESTVVPGVKGAPTPVASRSCGTW